MNNKSVVSIINNMKYLTRYDYHCYDDKNYTNRNRILNIDPSDLLSWIRRQDIDLAPFQKK